MLKKTEKRKIGDLGENIACSFLEKRSFEIIERNYSRKWGEIDIIARKSGVIRFIEVKSMVTRGTETYRPEDNMHLWKLKRLARAIQTYLLDRKLDCDWQLDLITVRLDEINRKARVEMMENIVI
ncbi:MAG: YraN family protein [Candidatus Zambryskibacteria bacterium]|nr:YraN family protein [Candidatus Zambryskibacteria bacterium]